MRAIIEGTEDQASICDITDIVKAKHPGDQVALSLDELDFQKWIEILKEDVKYNASTDTLLGVLSGSPMAITNGRMWRSIAKSQHKLGARIIDFALRRTMSPDDESVAPPSRISPGLDVTMTLHGQADPEATPSELPQIPADLTSTPTADSLPNRGSFPTEGNNVAGPNVPLHPTTTTDGPVLTRERESEPHEASSD